MFVLLALLLSVLLWQILNDFKPVLEPSLDVGSKLTSEAKVFPPEDTLKKNVLEKGPEMMEDPQGETSGVHLEKSQRTSGAGLRIWQTMHLQVSWDLRSSSLGMSSHGMASG